MEKTVVDELNAAENSFAVRDGEGDGLAFDPSLNEQVSPQQRSVARSISFIDIGSIPNIFARRSPSALSGGNSTVQTDQNRSVSPLRALNINMKDKAIAVSDVISDAVVETGAVGVEKGLRLLQSATRMLKNTATQAAIAGKNSAIHAASATKQFIEKQSQLRELESRRRDGIVAIHDAVLNIRGTLMQSLPTIERQWYIAVYPQIPADGDVTTRGKYSNGAGDSDGYFHQEDDGSDLEEDPAVTRFKEKYKVPHYGPDFDYTSPFGIKEKTESLKIRPLSVNSFHGLSYFMHMVDITRYKSVGIIIFIETHNVALTSEAYKSSINKRGLEGKSSLQSQVDSRRRFVPAFHGTVPIDGGGAFPPQGGRMHFTLKPYNQEIFGLPKSHQLMDTHGLDVIVSLMPAATPSSHYLRGFRSLARPATCYPNNGLVDAESLRTQKIEWDAFNGTVLAMGCYRDRILVSMKTRTAVAQLLEYDTDGKYIGALDPVTDAMNAAYGADQKFRDKNRPFEESRERHPNDIGKVVLILSGHRHVACCSIKGMIVMVIRRDEPGMFKPYSRGKGVGIDSTMQEPEHADEDGEVHEFDEGGMGHGASWRSNDNDDNNNNNSNMRSGVNNDGPDIDRSRPQDCWAYTVCTQAHPPGIAIVCGCVLEHVGMDIFFTADKENNIGVNFMDKGGHVKGFLNEGFLPTTTNDEVNELNFNKYDEATWPRRVRIVSMCVIGNRLYIAESEGSIITVNLTAILDGMIEYSGMLSRYVIRQEFVFPAASSTAAIAKEQARTAVKRTSWGYQKFGDGGITSFAMFAGNSFLGLRDEDALRLEEEKRAKKYLSTFEDPVRYDVLEGHTLLVGGNDLNPVLKVLQPHPKGMRELVTLQGHKKAITQIVADVAGRWIISCSSGDDTILIWDALSFTVERQLENVKIGGVMLAFNCLVVSSFKAPFLRMWRAQYAKVNYSSMLQEAAVAPPMAAPSVPAEPALTAGGLSPSKTGSSYPGTVISRTPSRSVLRRLGSQESLRSTSQHQSTHVSNGDVSQGVGVGGQHERSLSRSASSSSRKWMMSSRAREELEVDERIAAKKSSRDFELRKTPRAKGSVVAKREGYVVSTSLTQYMNQYMPIDNESADVGASGTGQYRERSSPSRRREIEGRGRYLSEQRQLPHVQSGMSVSVLSTLPDEQQQLAASVLDPYNWNQRVIASSLIAAEDRIVAVRSTRWCHAVLKGTTYLPVKSVVEPTYISIEARKVIARWQTQYQRSDAPSRDPTANSTVTDVGNTLPIRAVFLPEVGNMGDEEGGGEGEGDMDYDRIFDEDEYNLMSEGEDEQRKEKETDQQQENQYGRDDEGGVHGLFGERHLLSPESADASSFGFGSASALLSPTISEVPNGREEQNGGEEAGAGGERSISNLLQHSFDSRIASPKKRIQDAREFARQQQRQLLRRRSGECDEGSAGVGKPPGGGEGKGVFGTSLSLDKEAVTASMKSLFSPKNPKNKFHERVPSALTMDSIRGRSTSPNRLHSHSNSGRNGSLSPGSASGGGGGRIQQRFAQFQRLKKAQANGRYRKPAPNAALIAGVLPKSASSSWGLSSLLGNSSQERSYIPDEGEEAGAATVTGATGAGAMRAGTGKGGAGRRKRAFLRSRTRQALARRIIRMFAYKEERWIRQLELERRSASPARRKGDWTNRHVDSFTSSSYAAASSSLSSAGRAAPGLGAGLEGSFVQRGLPSRSSSSSARGGGNEMTETLQGARNNARNDTATETDERFKRWAPFLRNIENEDYEHVYLVRSPSALFPDHAPPSADDSYLRGEDSTVAAAPPQRRSTSDDNYSVEVDGRDRRVDEEGTDRNGDGPRHTKKSDSRSIRNSRSRSRSMRRSASSALESIKSEGDAATEESLHRDGDCGNRDDYASNVGNESDQQSDLSSSVDSFDSIQVRRKREKLRKDTKPLRLHFSESEDYDSTASESHSTSRSPSATTRHIPLSSPQRSRGRQLRQHSRGDRAGGVEDADVAVDSDLDVSGAVTVEGRGGERMTREGGGRRRKQRSGNNRPRKWETHPHRCVVYFNAGREERRRELTVEQIEEKLREIEALRKEALRERQGRLRPRCTEHFSDQQFDELE